MLGDSFAPSTLELLPAMDAFLRSPQHRQPLAAGQTDLVTRCELSIETLTELCTKTPSVGASSRIEIAMALTGCRSLEDDISFIKCE